MIALHKPFLDALPLIEQIQQAGFEAYFVGGSVRDALLGKKINDVDIATSAFPEEIKRIFRKTIDVGIEHGTVMVLWRGASYEVTTFRTESTYQDFRRPDKVEFVRSLEEDLKRRDFTVNALAMDKEGNIKDYFHGQEDLNNKVIKAVGSPMERFHEDALRMMRAVRFVSQLGFEMEETTLIAVKEHHALLEKISVERIAVEFVKMLQGKGRPQAVKLFVQTGLSAYCPGLANYKPQLLNFAAFKGILSTRLAAWTTLIHYLGILPEEVPSFLKDWKCSNKEIQQVHLAVETLRKRLQHTLTSFELYTAGLEIALTVENIVAQLGFNADIKQVQEAYEQLPIKSKKEIAINGNMIIQQVKAKPGKWLGDMLGQLEKLIVSGKLENERELLIEWVRNHTQKKN